MSQIDPLPRQSGTVVGTYWARRVRHLRTGSLAVYRIVEVAARDNGLGIVLPTVYAERLDDGDKSGHGRGMVRKVSPLRTFLERHRQVTEAEALELANA